MSEKVEEGRLVGGEQEVERLEAEARGLKRQLAAVRAENKRLRRVVLGKQAEADEAAGKLEQIRQAVEEMRVYAVKTGLVIGECVAWNRLKRLANTKGHEKSERHERGE